MYLHLKVKRNILNPRNMSEAGSAKQNSNIYGLRTVRVANVNGNPRSVVHLKHILYSFLDFKYTETRQNILFLSLNGKYYLFLSLKF